MAQAFAAAALFTCGADRGAMDTFLMFLLVGALAQAIDGALGMAYGVISSSVKAFSALLTSSGLAAGACFSSISSMI